MQKFIAITIISLIASSCNGAGNNLTDNTMTLQDTAGRPKKPAPVNIRDIRYEKVTDPLEKSFTMSMPAGWKNEAFLSRSYSLYKNVASSVSPDSRTVLYIGDAKLPFYTAPNDLLNAYPDIATSNPLMKIAYYVSADRYFTDYLTQKFGSFKGFKINSVTESPELRQIIENVIAKNNYQARLTTASIKFQYTADDKTMNCIINGATVDMGMTWFTDMNGIASLDDPAKYSEVLSTMVKSHQTDPAWKARQQQLHEQRMAQLRMDYANQQIAFNAMNQQHQIRMQNMQASHDAHNQNWANQQASIDRNHEKFLNVIRGEHTVMDGSGNTFQVDNSHQKYFVNKHTNKYIGTHSTTSLDDLRSLQGLNPDDYEEVKIIR